MLKSVFQLRCFKISPFVIYGMLLLPACQSPVETVEATDEQGQRIRYQRQKSNFAKEGLYERFFPNGAVAESAIYHQDSLDGARKIFYENGQLESSTPMVRGTFEGKYQKFRPDGSLEIEQTYVHGALEGYSIRYYPNGQIEEKVMLKDSEENGPFTEYYPNGKLKAAGTYQYVEDSAVEQGELREYDSTGTLIRIADCDNGVCRTRWKK
jgi:antitoxin component YwqK of YwqJK toxin-antitoxin module